MRVQFFLEITDTENFYKLTYKMKCGVVVPATLRLNPQPKQTLLRNQEDVIILRLANKLERGKKKHVRKCKICRRKEEKKKK